MQSRVRNDKNNYNLGGINIILAVLILAVLILAVLILAVLILAVLILAVRGSKSPIAKYNQRQ